MVGRVIAIPTGKRGDYLDFWRFERDCGQDLPLYGVRIVWSPSLRDNVKQVLRQAKADYIRDMERLLRDKRVIAYQSTQKQRMMFSQMRKIITEIMNAQIEEF